MAGADYLAAEVSGLDELMRTFDALGGPGTKAAIQSAMRKSLKPTAERARQLAPVGDPATRRGQVLRDSIAIRNNLSRSQRRKRRLRYDIEVFLGSTDPTAHLLEFGHVLTRGKNRARGKVIGQTIVKRTKSGRIVKVERQYDGVATTGRIVGQGFVRPYPFMRPAWDATRAEVHKRFLKLVSEEIDRVVKRYGKQAAKGKLTKGAREMLRIHL